MEDNQATIKIVSKGYSSKLRHIQRTHGINLQSIKEVLDMDGVSIEYVSTDHQSADFFTKALVPHKWANALELQGICTEPLNVLRAG